MWRVRGSSCKRWVLLVAMVTLVTWVSFTRPFSALYSFLHSKDSLKAIAMARSEVRGQEARQYFSHLPKRDQNRGSFRSHSQHTIQERAVQNTDFQHNQGTRNDALQNQGTRNDALQNSDDSFSNEDAHGEVAVGTVVHKGTVVQQGSYRSLLDNATLMDTSLTQRSHEDHGHFDLDSQNVHTDTTGRRTFSSRSDFSTKPQRENVTSKTDGHESQNSYGSANSVEMNMKNFRGTLQKNKFQKNNEEHTSDLKDQKAEGLPKETQKKSHAHNIETTSDPQQQYHVHADSSRHRDVKYAIAIITTRRPSPKRYASSMTEMDYVLQSAAALDAMVKTAEEFANSVLFICNVDKAPEKHSHAVHLKHYLLYIERFGNNSSFDPFSPTAPSTRMSGGRRGAGWVNMSAYLRFGPKVSQILSFGRRTSQKSSKEKFAEQLYRDATRSDRLEKERHDYMFCMASALTFDPRYVIMVEDDAYPQSDLPHVLDDVLRRITSRRNSPVCTGSSEFSISPCSFSFQYSETAKSSIQAKSIYNVTSNFAFVKLFLPEKWRGFYLFDPLRVIDLICIGIMGATLVLFLLCITSPRPSGFEPSWRTFFVGVVLSVVTAVLIGRQNLNELRRISKHLYRVEPSPGCCTPANLYPADVIPPLLTWLADSPRGKPLDFRLDQIAKVLDLPVFSVEPVLFRHIGLVSTLGNGSDQPEEFLFV